MKKFLGMLLLAAMSCSTMASTLTLTTKIDKILVSEDNGLMYVYPSADIETTFGQSLNACHDQTAYGSWGNFVTYRLTRPNSQEYISLMSMAFATNKTIDLVLDNNCTELGVSVALSYIRVHY